MKMIHPKNQQSELFVRNLREKYQNDSSCKQIQYHCAHFRYFHFYFIFSCFEDCYWYCIEERFCFDKNIGEWKSWSDKKKQNVIEMLNHFLLAANYNPDEDEYLTKRSKGFNELHFDGHDRPICEQPGRPEKIIRWAESVTDIWHPNDLYSNDSIYIFFQQLTHTRRRLSTNPNECSVFGTGNFGRICKFANFPR